MIKFKYLLIIFIAIFALSAKVFSEPKEITIGFIPSGDKEVTKKGAFLIAKSLQEQLGVPITIYISKSYSSMITALKEKRVDFAFLSAASYVAAEKQLKIQILLKKIWFEPFYYSVLLVKKKSKINSIEDLKRKRITFVDKKSTSGYLYPQVMFKNKGILEGSFKTVNFSGSHAQSVLALEKNETDAIAVFSDDKEGTKSAWVKFASKKNDFKDVKILWLSEPIPNDPFCVRQDFYEDNPKLVHNLMFSLIDVVEKLKSNKLVSDTVGASGFLPATSRQYDPVREMVKALGEKIEP